MISSIRSVSLLLAVLFCTATASGVEVPKEIAGFRLGKDITEYSDIEYSNYLKEVVVTDRHGFRKGIISYGICALPGKIVRISMKYEDSSKAFYEELLTKYKQRFDKPTLWEGDAFGILYKWKWTFRDENNERVNLILQHNLKNHNENIGNLVKLYYPDRENDERLCFIKQCEINKSEEDQQRLKARQQMDWEFMIPR